MRLELSLPPAARRPSPAACERLSISGALGAVRDGDGIDAVHTFHTIVTRRATAQESASRRRDRTLGSQAVVPRDGDHSGGGALQIYSDGLPTGARVPIGRSRRRTLCRVLGYCGLSARTHARTPVRLPAEDARFARSVRSARSVARTN